MEIKFENVTKKFGSITAVAELSFIIPARKLVCVVGPSGCGKTTLLSLLAGLLALDAGRIHLNGQLASDDKIRLAPQAREIGMVFQSLALWPHMTVTKNLEFVLKRRGLAKEIRAEKIKNMLALIQLTGAARKYPGELSEGERQRVALARALIIEPKIFLLDEPLSNLDQTLTEKMLSEITGFHKKFATTTVYVTHDQSEALARADLMVVMNEGKFTQMGSPEEIYCRPKNKFTARFIGCGTLLQGELIKNGLVRTELGELKCETNPAMQDKKVRVLIRPENVSFGVSGSFQGKVLENEFRGDRWLVKIQTSTKTVIQAYTDRKQGINDQIGFNITCPVWCLSE